MKSSGKLSRWGLRLLMAAVLLAVIALGILYGLARSADSQWERLAAEIRARGEPLTYEEIIAARASSGIYDRPRVPLRQALAELARIEETDHTDVFLFDHHCKFDILDEITADCIEPTRQYVAARRAALDLLRQPVTGPNADLNINYTGSTMEISSAPLEVGPPIRTLGRLGSAEAKLHIIDRDAASAVETLAIQLRQTEPLYAEPSLLLMLIAIANNALTAHTTVDLLNAFEVDAAELARLQAEFEQHAESQTIKWVLLGERASILGLTDLGKLMADYMNIVRYDPATGQPGAPVRPSSLIPFLDDWLFSEYRLGAVTVYSKLVEAADNPRQLMLLGRQEDYAVQSGWGVRNKIVRMLLPGIVRSFELFARGQAMHRSTLAAIAAERYRIANGEFPESLDDLVPDFLVQVPTDPFDGKPLRLMHTVGGIVVYSVGENRKDDGGSVVPTKGHRIPTDFGVRLLNPDLRKMTLVPRNDSE